MFVPSLVDSPTKSLPDGRKKSAAPARGGMTDLERGLEDQVAVAAPPAEPMKRFTIDVPAGLHRRVKAACDKRGLKVSSVLRDLLEREFPDTSRQLPLL